MDRRLKVAMGQMLVEGGRPGDNLGRAVEMIQQAARHRCDLIVLPECLDLGWTDPSAIDLADCVPGRSTRRLSSAAREKQIYVVAGVVERAPKGLYNTALLVGPDGAILAKHRKINELTIARGLYELGQDLAVVETPIGFLGLTICADNSPDSLMLAHSLARMGAQLFPSPCAWAVDADHDNDTDPYGEMWRSSYTDLAERYEVTVIGVSNVGPITGGPWAGRKCIGCSLAVGPGGRILAEGPYDKEALITVDVALRPPVGWGTSFSERMTSPTS